MSHLLFNFFAAFTVITAAGVVVNRNAVNAAMCLLLCLAGIAGLFVQLEAYLLAFLLILVYAGAIVALFLFIIIWLEDGGADGRLRWRFAACGDILNDMKRAGKKAQLKRVQSLRERMAQLRSEESRAPKAG